MSEINIADDMRWMRRALRLAAKGFTPPNPMVGCVIVREGRVLGEGFHPYAGAPHAEVFALLSAGESAQNATAYVSLEPCAHFGRTPPCSRALISAGVQRVVAATRDPNPRVAGRGIAELMEAGISVTVGILEKQARRLNEAFFYYQKTGLPFVTLKAATTLDGKIATRTGSSRWITGEAARKHVHRLRARSSAVLVGVGTVVADDPMLDARINGVEHQPLRVVLDPHLRTPLTSRLVTTAAQIPTLLVAAPDADWDRESVLTGLGVDVLRVTTDAAGRLLLPELLSALAKRDVISLFVEGGGETHSEFLAHRCVNRVMWFIAPKLVGGREAPTSVEGEGVAAMSQAIPVTGLQVHRFGPDVMLEGVPVWGEE